MAKLGPKNKYTQRQFKIAYKRVLQQAYKDQKTITKKEVAAKLNISRASLWRYLNN